MSPVVRIILVDGEAEYRDHFSSALGAETGFRLENCAEVIELPKIIAKRQGPTIAILPGRAVSVDVLEVLRWIKTNAVDVPTVVCADKLQDVTRLRFLEHGADEFVLTEAAVAVIRKIADALKARMPSPPAAAARKAGPSPESRDKGQMYFQLKADELGNAVQFLCMTARTGELDLTFASGVTGKLFLHNNTVAHAELGDAKGIEALARMLSMGQMEARFFEGRKPLEMTNDKPISQVLIEASVMADEMVAN